MRLGNNMDIDFNDKRDVEAYSYKMKMLQILFIMIIVSWICSVFAFRYIVNNMPLQAEMAQVTIIASTGLVMLTGWAYFLNISRYNRLKREHEEHQS